MPQSEKPERHVEEQARQQTGQHQIHIRVEDRGAAVAYANAFRTNATAEEVILDFGINTVQPAQPPQDQPEILFQVSQRVVMNLYSAKRLAITLSQVIRRHEDQFGVLELDVAKRQQKPSA
jgi:hypothetical protein